MTSGAMSPLDRLFALEQFRIKLGLEAMRALLWALGAPEQRWPSLHIAGTNGKGSTAAMVERALRAQGHRTGRYTSPHLHRVEERVAIDGHDIAPPAFAHALERVFAASDDLQARGVLPHGPTFFEVSTAAAFVAFAEAKVDIAVVEVGLGGRFDATNVVVPVAGAITSIAFDHERHLGTTLDAIAREKAGIAKAGVPLVVGDVGGDALHAIETSARDAGAVLIEARDGVSVHERLIDGALETTITTAHDTYGPLRLGLSGAHQGGNAVVAVRLLEAWAAATGHALRRSAVETGLSDVVWPARLEWLQAPGTSVRVLIDAAHNPAGAAALASYLRTAGGPPVTLVTSVMADKDVSGLLTPLVPHVARVIATAADTPRALPAAVLGERIAALVPPGTPVDVVANPLDAIGVARSVAGAHPVLLAGSIYLVGPLRAALLDAGYRSTR